MPLVCEKTDAYYFSISEASWLHCFNILCIPHVHVLVGKNMPNGGARLGLYLLTLYYPQA